MLIPFPCSHGIFLDFEKAYEMVWKKGLLYKNYNLGIKGHMCNFIDKIILIELKKFV